MRSGPGLRVAAPSELGSSNWTIFECGTSHATALVTREASMLFDLLEERGRDSAVLEPPDPMFHPLLVRALLAHASSWGDWWEELGRDLPVGRERRRLTPLLGYGRIDPERARGAVNRAVVIAGNSIGMNERHSYALPLPPSIRSKAEWHRVSITLAYWAPVTHGLKRYRASKVFFTTPKVREISKLVGGKRVDAEHSAVMRGSLQHEVIEGDNSMGFGNDAIFPVHVECMKDGQCGSEQASRIRYALVASIETAAETSTTVHDEVRAGLLRLRAQSQARQRSRVRNR